MLGYAGIQLILASLMIFFSFLAFFFIPLTGTLIRLRANFAPKRLQLLADDGEQERPVNGNSYVGMFKKVHRIEGWGGLYKGIFCYILMSVLAFIVGAGSIGGFRADTSKFDVQLFRMANRIIFGMLMLPLNVLMYRSIVTPYTMSDSWRRNMHILFSPDERQAIWRIYTIPGLVVANACQVVFVNISTTSLAILLSWPASATSDKKAVLILLEVSVIIAMVITTIVLPPLEVLLAKLATQRYPTVEEITEDPHFTLAVRYADDGLETIEIRQDQPPYTGFIDCFKTVIKEEGWRTLYRGWWVTLIGDVLLFCLFFVGMLLVTPWFQF
ncbi:hypothetical protein C8J56DRAFT_336654 [Mycena floridula]|nr:hypothetical protein C8J56DRAFT_336654 [Mycena floridula]